MAFSVVASATAPVPLGPTSTTGSIDTTGATLIVIGCGAWDTASPSDPTDSKSNTWTALTLRGNSSDAWARLYYCINPTVGSGHTFTITNAYNDALLTVIAVSGDSPTFDAQSGTNSGTQPGSISPAGDDELFVSLFHGRFITSVTVGSSFTEIGADYAAEYTGGNLAYKIQTTGGAENPTWSETGAIAMAVFSTTPSSTLDQTHARFRNDDGSETTATWAAAEDTNASVALSTNIRARLQVEATGDPASAIAYTLRAQKNGSGGYTAVPVGASVAEAYGTVTFGAIGTGANGSTSVAPSYPSGITAGQYLTCQVSSGATNSETPDTPSGWTLLGTGASTDGSYGVDTGPRRMTVFGKEATGSESGTLTVTITNGGTCRGTIIRWTKAGSGAWDVVGQGGNDSSSGTGFSAATASINWNTGDATLVGVGQRVDTVTQSSQSLTASGVTFGTRTNQASTAVTTGNDHRHVVDTFAAITSTSDVDAAPTWAYTGSAACSGGVVIVRLREYTAPVTNELYIATSANITAGGEATTGQLTDPGNTFVTGRMWDDENGTDTTDITADNFSEFEWCLQAQSPATGGDYWDLRLYAGSTALGTYTVTPRLTVSGGGGATFVGWISTNGWF